MMESLDRAIKELNDWNGAALLYFNKNEGYFNTEVYVNDIEAVQTILAEGNYGVWRKSQYDGKHRNIGKARKEYILDYVNLLLEGYDPMQAEYKLYDKYPPHHIMPPRK